MTTASSWPKSVALTLQPQRWDLVVCLVLGTLGLVLVAAGIATIVGNNAWGGGMIGSGALWAYHFLPAGLSSVTVTPDGVQYRKGLALRSIPVGEIQRIEVAPIPRRGRPVVALVVFRHDDLTVPLVTTGRFASAGNRQVLVRQATEAAEILGLP